jgi:hypothetical protein
VVKRDGFIPDRVAAVVLGLCKYLDVRVKMGAYAKAQHH